MLPCMATATTKKPPPKRAAKPPVVPVRLLARLTMPSDRWRQIINMLMPTCSIKEPTKYSGAVQFAKIGRECYLCSTNGHALTAYRLADVAESPGEPVLLLGAWLKTILLPILPNKLLDIVDVTLRETDAGEWVFEWEGVSLKARTLDVKFPEWKPRIMPDPLPPVTITLGCALTASLLGPDTRTKDQNAFARLHINADDPTKPASISYQDKDLQRIIMPIRTD